ncbi:MAG TPA: hypothetical protein VGE07_13985 [Herpetosiphonaceae bacterium]
MERSQRNIGIAATIFAWLVAALMLAALATAATGRRPRIRLAPSGPASPEQLIVATYDEWPGALMGGGIAGAVFGDGTGYVLEVDTWETDGRPALSRVTPFRLSDGELTGLVGVFQTNAFFTIDERLESPTRDGTTVKLAYAERGMRHSSTNHMVEHRQFAAIDTHFKALLEQRQGADQTLTTSGLLERAIAHLDKLPPGSEERAVISAFYDDWLLGSGIRPALQPEQLAVWDAVRNQR